ncbi:TPA_exp: Uncharacterized protein A8136_1611 [Trichophyton benhamiae CBS 112371]|nr:TPA_exp: Uncharacterized protein A8136_1611 [Trichophyton benhamiae CBS 112371]
MRTRSKTPPQGMSYTPSYANDEHRRIAAAALRLSHLHPPASAAYILDAGCMDFPVDIEVVDADAAEVDADTDRDAEDWRRIKMLAADSTGSTEGSQLRTDLLSHSHSHSLSHSRRSHQSHRSRLSQQSRRHSSQADHQDAAGRDHEEEEEEQQQQQEEDEEAEREEREYDEEEYDEEADEDELEPGCSHENAFFVLLRISFCLPPFTIFAALYAFISLIFLLLAIPLRLCPPSHFFKPPTSLTEQVCRLLVPLLRLNRRTVTSPTNNHDHRRRRRRSSSSSSSHHHRHDHHSHHAKRSRRHYSTHSSLPASALTSPRQSYTISTSTPVSASLSSSTIPTQPVTATDSASTPASTTTPAAADSSTSRLYANYSAPMLVVVHLLSPLLLPPTLLAAWICACFWIFVMIMGNPDGKEKTDDGRAAVLAVRNWWCLWLASARRKRRKRDPEAGSV